MAAVRKWRPLSLSFDLCIYPSGGRLAIRKYQYGKHSRSGTIY